MYSHLPVDRLVAHFEALPRDRVWFVVVTAVAVLAIADDRFRDFGLALLYIPIIWAASWKLGARAGFLIALAATVLSAASHFDEGAYYSLAVGVRTLVQLSTFLFAAAIVASFRRSFDRERDLALRDRMTHALNKEAFEERAAAMLEAAARTKETLVLAILDLDDFKGVNSKHGHVVGDAVLRAFAKGAVGILRRGDAFGRIGGDEFAFLLPVNSSKEGRCQSVTLHARVTAVLARTEYPITCSMGALLIGPRPFSNIGALMNLADQAMYRAKHAGKDGLEIAEVSASQTAEVMGLTAELGARHS